jgi:hypothetical protein
LGKIGGPKQDEQRKQYWLYEKKSFSFTVEKNTIARSPQQGVEENSHSIHLRSNQLLEACYIKQRCQSNKGVLKKDTQDRLSSRGR